MLKDPISLVVFGATGDLMARKILPSLFYLHKEKKLPDGFRVVGVSRRDISEEGFREKMREAAGQFEEIREDKKLAGFLKLFYFVKGYFGDRYTYEDLKRVLEGHDHKIFFYLASAPKFYKMVLQNIADAGLINKRTFLLIEKPIGFDLKSAREVEKVLSKYFKEEQIYRVDHYLAKDGMAKIRDFKFDPSLVKKIELRLWEKKDAAGRGEFYDSIGALRDVGQNHLLVMLSYAALAKPEREVRAELLRKLKVYKSAQAKNFSYRAQYRGFREEDKVKRNSKTETFFRVTAFLKKGGFKGIPIILEAGKALPEIKKEVVINFKDGRKFVFPIETHKVKYQYVEEYKKILQSAFTGDDSMFLGRDEVLASWKFIDPISLAFRKNMIKLKFYEPNTYPFL